MGRRGRSAVAAPAGWYEVIRGPRPPSVSWSTFPKGKKAAATARSRRSRRCQFHVADGAKVHFSKFVSVVQSSATELQTKSRLELPARSPGCNLPLPPWERTTIRKKVLCGSPQEGANAGRGSSGARADLPDSEIHREGEETGCARRIRSVDNGAEGLVRQGVGRCRRTSLEIAYRGRAAHASGSRYFHGCPTVVKAARAVAGPLQQQQGSAISVSDPKRPRRFHVFQ